MSEFQIGGTAGHRSGFHVLVVLCFANGAICYLIHGANYAFVPVLLGAALLFDIFWPKVGGVERSREDFENKVSQNDFSMSTNLAFDEFDLMNFGPKVDLVLASNSESTPVSQLATNQSEENNNPMRTDDDPAPSTPAQRQTSESDDYWDEKFRSKMCQEHGQMTVSKPGQGGKWQQRDESKARLARMQKLIDAKNAELGVTR
ncbi:Pre-mRNA-splicing factor ATP-dependent RNA helicase-like protein [Venturia nashicola]|uniref:Pre-mRNA-splicing factor ATP-dependent RNA helicase-like protein n=1 Tax=Venturia nashicola TaxID=86259 RepID=A0A4Z1P5W5_9PEZI|nr:Pre-mRNA-splicing factor ATP-dependent RNA helicase-like protein [Venturia nashicola]